jgi:predicted Zn-dependent peptidase
MYVLDNGLRVIFKPTQANNIFAIDCMIDVGSIYEFQDKAGITNFTQTLLMKGTKKRRADEIALELESMGASMGTDAHEDYVEVSAISILEDADKVLEIMADVVFNPSFPEDEVEKERRNILDSIRLSEDNKFVFTYKNFRKLLYGESHPYGRPVEGTPETVKSISRGEILQHHSKYYQPSNMIVSVVANMEKDEILSLLKKYIPKATGEPPVLVSADKKTGERSRFEVKRKEIEQAFIIVGYQTCGISDEDYITLKVISSLMGEGMSSRLFVRLRDEQGLAYSVGCAMPSRKLRSHFFAWIGTKPENITQAKDGMINEIERLKSELVNMEELDRAKKYIIGRFLLDHQTNIRQAWYLGWYEMLGVGRNYDDQYTKFINNVTREDIIRCARKYFNTAAVEILRPKIPEPE